MTINRNNLIDSVYPLLESRVVKDKVKITGPFAPVALANEIKNRMGFKYNHLARVSFNNEEVLNSRDGDGITGYDFLVLVAKGSKFVNMALVIDMGVHTMPVALRLHKDELVTTGVYDKCNDFMYKLDDNELNYLFDFILEKSSRYESVNKE